MFTVITLLSAMVMAVLPPWTSMPSARLMATTMPVMGLTAEKFSRFFSSSSTFFWASSKDFRAASTCSCLARISSSTLLVPWTTRVCPAVTSA